MHLFLAIPLLLSLYLVVVQAVITDQELKNRFNADPNGVIGTKIISAFHENEDTESKVIQYHGSVTQWDGKCWLIEYPADGDKECVKLSKLIKMIRKTEKFQAQQPFEEDPREVIGTEIIAEFFKDGKEGQVEKIYGQVTDWTGTCWKIV